MDCGDGKVSVSCDPSRKGGESEVLASDSSVRRDKGDSRFHVRSVLVLSAC